MSPVVPVSRVSEFAPVADIVPTPANVRSVAVTPIVSREITPVSAPSVETFNPPFEVTAKVPVALPIATFPVPVVAIFTSDAPEVPRFVVPVDERVVKAPVDGVVAPIAVLLIPVAVAVKLPEVISKLFTPALIDDADNPERLNTPEVAVRLIAPVVRVSPFDAVKRPADVIAPVPVVAIFPLVVRFPSSLMVRVAEPEDWISSAVLTEPLVSFIKNALAVP